MVQLTKFGNFHPVVCTCDGGAQGNGKNGLEFMAARARKTRVGDELQVLQQCHGALIQ